MSSCLRVGSVNFLIITLALTGCHPFSSDRSFIPGIYVRHYRDEYTDSYDTIVIRLKSKDTYLVIKNSSYQRINDDGHRVPGAEIKKWLGTYDSKTRALLLTPAGKQIYFGPGRNEITLGTVPYKKLNS